MSPAPQEGSHIIWCHKPGPYLVPGEVMGPSGEATIVLLKGHDVPVKLSSKLLLSPYSSIAIILDRESKLVKVLRISELNVHL